MRRMDSCAMPRHEVLQYTRLCAVSHNTKRALWAWVLDVYVNLCDYGQSTTNHVHDNDEHDDDGDDDNDYGDLSKLKILNSRLTTINIYIYIFHYTLAIRAYFFFFFSPRRFLHLVLKTLLHLPANCYSRTRYSTSCSYLAAKSSRLNESLSIQLLVVDSFIHFFFFFSSLLRFYFIIIIYRMVDRFGCTLCVHNV